MKIDDFLKPKKVRFIANDNRRDLTNGKVYDVIGATYGRLKIHNDNGGNSWYDMDCFELVIESEENPLQDMELTPEFEAVEPVLADNRQVNIQDIGPDILDTNADIKDTAKFKVGDKVYVGLTGKIARVTKIIDDDVVNVANKNNEVRAWVSNICHANPENYERLQATFPDIEFEQPPKELKGSDLCFEKLRNGKKLVMCAVSDLSDEKAIKRLEDDNGCIRIIKDYDPAPYHFIDTHGIRHGFAVPLNDETGEPLTQAVLDE